MRFPNASIADIDLPRRGLDQSQILSLAQGDWIRAREQIILTGQTGTGKTWLACASTHQAGRSIIPSSISACPGSWRSAADSETECRCR